MQGYLLSLILGPHTEEGDKYLELHRIRYSWHLCCTKLASVICAFDRKTACLAHCSWESVTMSSFALLSLGVMEQVKGHGALRRERHRSAYPVSPAHQRNTMTAPYAVASEWVHVGPTISAAALRDVEN